MIKLKVKNIVNVKETENGHREFEVEWENSWESEDYLCGIAGDLIKNFLNGKTEENNNNVSNNDEDDDEDIQLTIDEGLEVDDDNDDHKEREQDGDVYMKETDEPVLTDLFNIPNPSKPKKSGKGINAIISRLQKTKQEEHIDTDQGYDVKFPVSPEEASKVPDGLIQSSEPSQRTSSATSSSYSNIEQLNNIINQNAPTASNSNATVPSSALPTAVTSASSRIIYEPVFKCAICSEIFCEDAKFQQHMFMHDQVNLLKQVPPQLLKPGTYECKFCREIFDDKDKLKVHYSEQHEKEFVDTQPIDQRYKCTMCDLTFIDYPKFLQHQQAHAQRKEVFILPKQQIQTATLLALEGAIHIPKTEAVALKVQPFPTIKNDDDAPSIIAPSMTTLDFQPVNAVLLSKTNMDADRKMFRCNICDELFETEELRAKHSLIHVNRSSSLDCHICGKQFRHRTNLSTHMIVHSGVKPHQCHICWRRFTQKVNLQRHMHIHDGSRPFICSMCSKSFTQKANLQRHILSHTECSKEDVLKALNEIPNESEVNNAINESLSEAMIVVMGKRTVSEPTGKSETHCEICDKTFPQKANLQKHMLIHLDTASRPFQCYVCGKAFRQRSTLQKHYTIHTNSSGSFICQTCNRLFSSKTNLQQHMLVHAKSGTNECYLCDQSFAITESLERHFSEHIEEAVASVALPQKVFEHSTSGQSFRCANCDVIFESPIIFNQHLQCHQGGFSPASTNMEAGDIIKAYEENQDFPLQCNACDLIFMSVSKLEAHMLTHSADTVGSSSCKIMTAKSLSSPPVDLRPPSNGSSTPQSSSASPSGITSIKQEEVTPTTTPSNRPSRCPVCKEMFSCKESMREHYSSEHIKNDLMSSVSDDQTGADFDAENEDVFIDMKPVEETIVEETIKSTSGITENEERLIRENEDFIKDNILGGPAEYESKGRYERGNYSCKICNRVLTYKYSLEKHMLLHTGSFPHKCHLCSKRFNHKANLDKHLVVHSGEKPYVCHICQRPFSQKSNLQRHQLTHTQNRDFVCEVCGKRFNHMASLKTHSLIHTGAKPFACYVCNKRFNQKGNLKRHIQTHRNGKRNKINSINNNGSEDMDYDDEPASPTPEDVYNATMEDIEGKSPPPASPESGNSRSERLRVKKQMNDYEFYGDEEDDEEPLPTMIGENTDEFNGTESSYPRSNIKEEIVTVMPSDALDDKDTIDSKTDTKPPQGYHCNNCSKVFISLESLEIHQKNSHSQIICEVCGKQFSQKANLLKHKLIHANKKPFPCRVCNKAFRQKANLQRHELIHNKDRKTVSCTECNKTFRCAWSLKQHMKNHSIASNDFLFGCSICGKTFKEKEQLQQHFNVHDGTVTLFSCPLCDSKFSSKDELLQHVDTTHQGISTDRKELIESEADKNIVKYEPVSSTRLIALQSVTAMIPVTTQ